VIALRKEILALGLVIIFAGLLLAAGSDTTAEHRWTSQTARTLDEWSISCSFQKGDNVTLDIVGGQGWGYIFQDYDEPLPLNLSFVAPDSSETLFRVFFLGNPPQRPGQEEFDVYWYNATLLRPSDGLTVADPPTGIGGITTQDGVYTATLLKDGFWWGGSNPKPPRTLTFYKESVAFSKPYSILFPVGGAICFLGTGVSVYGLKHQTTAKSKRRRHRR